MPLLADVITTPRRAIHSALAKPTSRKPAAEKATARAIRTLKEKTSANEINKLIRNRSQTYLTQKGKKGISILTNSEGSTSASKMAPVETK